MRRSAAPPRGIVTLRPGPASQHRRLLPCPELEPFVAHFWWVSWSVPRPTTVETLPHPVVHVTFEAPGRAQIGGVATARFTRTLRGDGRVFGVKFRPAAFAPWIAAGVSSLTNRRIPARRVFGHGLERLVAGAGSLEDAIAAAEPFLCARRPELPQDVAELRDLVERVERDRSLVRVEQLARLAGCTMRTLQRAFRRHVGVSAKWVIGRYRLHEALEQLRSGSSAIADVAGQLGYFDQAHFTRDFKAMVGRAPAAFAAATLEERRATSGRSSSRASRSSTRP
jgi:AraC-like DNA-binding protein